MKWYWQIRGGHTHVRVFMNGGKCGDLCFRNEEFKQIRHGNSLREGVIAAFINDDPPKADQPVTEQTMHDILVKPNAKNPIQEIMPPLPEIKPITTVLKTLR